MNTQGKLIYLTSLPRSGSTWAGQAIAAALNSRMINEPFNWLRYPDRKPFHMQFLPGNTQKHAMLDIITCTLNSPNKGINDLWYGKFKVIKDVHSCLALEYIWESLHPHILVLIRHPCGMAVSWSKLGLEIEFRLDLLYSQPSLVDEFLEPYRDHIYSNRDYFFQIGAYWGATYLVLLKLAQKYPEWQWATHEALCIDTEQRYRQWLTDARIHLTKKNIKRLRRFISKHNRDSQGNYSAARITALEPEKWKHVLNPNQIKNCLSGAAPFGLLEKFYNPEAPFITGSLAEK